MIQARQVWILLAVLAATALYGLLAPPSGPGTRMYFYRANGDPGCSTWSCPPSCLKNAQDSLGGEE